jgi:Domain of unknown function (DUF6429)
MSPCGGAVAHHVGAKGRRLTKASEPTPPVELHAAAGGGRSTPGRWTRRAPGSNAPSMEYDEERVDDAVLALLWLTMFEDRGITRAWKNHDWKALDRLHAKGFIGAKSKAKSVVVTEAGKERAHQLFDRLFGRTV